MVLHELSVPHLFRCPISMDVMMSPVSLCTGVTYDRSSIQLWLDSGHDTCPATMQILPSKDLVPNLTLRRLIHLWFLSNAGPPPSPRLLSPSDLPPLLLHPHSLSAIAHLAASSDHNRSILATSDDLVLSLVDLVAGGSQDAAIRVLEMLLAERPQARTLVSKRMQAFLDSISTAMRTGNLETKIAAAGVLRSIAVDQESTRAVTENKELVEGMVGVLGAESEQAAHETVLWSLIAVGGTRATKAQLAGSGLVRHIAEIMTSGRSSKGAVEKAMRMAAIVSSCAEGRSALSSEGGRALGAVVERLLKVSRAGTEDGVLALWNACCGGAGERRKAREAVGRSKGARKLLLVMQSGCSERVRHMCGDVLRVLKAAVELEGSYESKTSHIMHC